MKKRIVCAGAMLAVLLMMTSCFTRQRETLVIGLLPDIDSVPFVVAYLRGYFHEDIELQVFPGPLHRDTALFAGALDGSISDVLAVGLARNAGHEVYITIRTDGRKGIVTFADIDSPADLEGMEIGMSLNTIIDYIVDRAVLAYGGDPDLVIKTSVPAIPSRLELLLNRQIDAVAFPEPFVTVAALNGANVVASSDIMGIAPEVILMTRNAMENKFDLVQNLFDGYDRAVVFINSTDSAEFMPDVIEFLGLPADSIYVDLPVYSLSMIPDESEVDAAIEWLYNRGMIERPFTFKELLWDPNLRN